jgi:hypothetical protein
MLMDDVGNRKQGIPSQPLVLIILLCALLLGLGIWNIRQSWVIKQQRQRLAAPIQSASTVKIDADVWAEQAKRRQADAAETDARVSQLYREIDNLTRMSEQIMVHVRSSPSSGIPVVPRGPVQTP